MGKAGRKEVSRGKRELKFMCLDFNFFKFNNIFVLIIMISSEERSSEKKEKRREKQKSESRSNNYIKEDAECVAISFDLYFFAISFISAILLYLFPEGAISIYHQP